MQRGLRPAIDKLHISDGRAGAARTRALSDVGVDEGDGDGKVIADCDDIDDTWPSSSSMSQLVKSTTTELVKAERHSL